MTLWSWFAAGTSLGLGAGILGLWTMLLVTKQVPEIRRRDRAVYFHISAETATGIALVAAGGSAIFEGGARWTLGLLAAALGAVLYSTINSPGYYAQQRKWGAVAMFGGLALIAGAALAATIAALKT